MPDQVQHPYELFLQFEEIKHRTHQGVPATIEGLVERFHSTVLEEHFRVEGRSTLFETIDEMLKVLDDRLVAHNTKRLHQGRGINGRTPLKAFTDDLKKAAAPSPKKPKGEQLTQSPKQTSIHSEPRAARRPFKRGNVM